MGRAKSTLEQWRILQAVVDCGGYAQAASHLNKSQSSLNHAVAKLQNQLGVSLLEVKGRKAFLTPQGEVLLRRSRQITQSVSELERLANNLEQGWEPHLTIARDLVYPMEKVITIFEAFYPSSRGTRITILDSVISGTRELIESKSVDLALCAGAPPKGFIGQPLCQVDFMLVCHPAHQLASTSSIEDEHALTQHLQLVIKDTGDDPEENIGWLKAEQRLTVSNFHEAKAFLANNLGFCWIPEYLITEELDAGLLHRLKLQGGDRRSGVINLIVPDRDHQGPAAKLLESLFLAEHKIKGAKP